MVSSFHNGISKETPLKRLSCYQNFPSSNTNPLWILHYKNSVQFKLPSYPNPLQSFYLLCFPSFFKVKNVTGFPPPPPLPLLHPNPLHKRPSNLFCLCRVCCPQLWFVTCAAAAATCKQTSLHLIFSPLLARYPLKFISMSCYTFPLYVLYFSPSPPLSTPFYPGQQSLFSSL